MNPSLFVVDASVAVKWFIPEAHSAAASRLQGPGRSLHVPTFFNVEMGNIFWKKVQRGDLTTAEATEMVNRLPTLPLIRHPTQSLVLPAFDLACQTGRTVYDSLYLALAIHLDGRMATADQRFVNALAVTPYAVHVCRVEDLP